MDDPNEVVRGSVNDQPLIANSNHTIELARMVREYTLAYDKWNNLTKDALRKAQESIELKKKIADLAIEIKEQMK